MKSLADFIEIGEKCGLKGDELLAFARKELEVYDQAVERELRLEERRL